jgi:hypothetical protein
MTLLGIPLAILFGFAAGFTCKLIGKTAYESKPVILFSAFVGMIIGTFGGPLAGLFLYLAG